MDGIYTGGLSLRLYSPWDTSKTYSPVIVKNTAGGNIQIYTYGSVGYYIHTIITFNIFDLTIMFGEGNEPQTFQEFNEKIGNSIFNNLPSLPYETGKDVVIIDGNIYSLNI